MDLTSNSTILVFFLADSSGKPSEWIYLGHIAHTSIHERKYALCSLGIPWDSLGPQKAGPSPCRDLMGFALCNAYIFTDIFPATPFLPLMPLVPQVCGRMPGSCPVRTRSRLNTWAAVKISCLRLVPKYRLSMIFSFCGGGYRFIVFCSNQNYK